MPDGIFFNIFVNQYVTKYLNQILIRDSLNGPIHQLDHYKRKVDSDYIDWPDRITLHFNTNVNKIVMIERPNEEELFISYPIYIDSHYALGRGEHIINLIHNLAAKYGLESIINAETMPRHSIDNLLKRDIVLSELSPLIAKIFLVVDKKISEEFFEIEPDLIGTQFEHIGLGNLLFGRRYKLGEYLPNPNPVLISTTVKNPKEVWKHKFLGEKETKQKLKLEQKLSTLEQEYREINAEIDKIEASIASKQNEIELLDAKMNYIRTENEYKKGKYRAMSWKIDLDTSEKELKMADVMEYLDSNLDKHLEEYTVAIELIQENLIDSYTNLEELSQTRTRIETERFEVQSELNEISRSLEELILKYENNAAAPKQK